MRPSLTFYLLDDEELFLDQFKSFLTDYLNKNSSFACNIRCFTNADQMLEAAGIDVPALLFSDIQLNGADSGISYADRLCQIIPGCQIIYLTSFLQYAPDVFDTNPLYFILKDDYQNRLPAAMKKFFSVYQQTHGSIQVTSENKHVIIPWSSIYFCEHSGKNVFISTREGNYTVRSSITEFLDRLPSGQFAMCHKSFIVNLARVRSITRLKLTLDDGTVLNISRSYCDDFRKAHSRWISEIVI